MDMGKFVQSKWLKSDDVSGLGTLTIQRAYPHEFDQSNETKPVVEFLELDQALVLNKTRTRAMIAAFGANSDGWKGKRVKLSTTPTSMGASIVVESAEATAAAVPADVSWD